VARFAEPELSGGGRFGFSIPMSDMKLMFKSATRKWACRNNPSRYHVIPMAITVFLALSCLSIMTSELSLVFEIIVPSK